MERRTPVDQLWLLAKEGTETERKLQVAGAVFDGMLSAYKNHQELGEDGKKKDRINQFEDQALRADIEAEEQVLESLKLWAQKANIKLNYRGEEVGKDTVGIEGGEPYLALIDGLDGSDNYKQKTDWPYGTMVAVAKGEDPNYEDFEVAGVTLHEEGLLILAIKNLGVWVYDTERQTSMPLPRFDNDGEYDEERILADDYFPETQELLGEKRGIWPRTGSTAATISALVMDSIIKDDKYPMMNEGWQALVDVTRKGNLEQPVLYLMINELGGFMVDRDGKSIGDYNFDIWGQNEKVPVITSRSSKIIEKIREQLGLVN